jgi:hypothetical protein
MTKTRIFTINLFLALICQSVFAQTYQQEAVSGYEYRKPDTDSELQYWLHNMIYLYDFSIKEISAATGLGEREIENSLLRFKIDPKSKPRKPDNSLLRIAPWPGGRAVSNWGGRVEQTRQRETKFAVFAPWDPTSYVVLDIPEAIFSNLGFIYLAHEHVETLWTKKKIKLKKLEWNCRKDGSLDLTRQLPNGVVYSAKVVPFRHALRMKISLRNETSSPLSKLRVQNCVFLKGLSGFDNESTPKNINLKPYNAMGTADGKHWAITAWIPGGKTWGNIKNPCFHSDPTFEDCPPGQTRIIYGWFSFYEGENINMEFEKIEMTGWRNDKWEDTPEWPETSDGYH